MTTSLESLQPKVVWKHFADLLRIPRPSGHEERVVAHIEQWAGAKQLEVAKDRVGNVVVRVPATPGHERAPIVILQGHLDMVAEKRSDFAFDFSSDPIPVRVDGEWVVADDTTLGGDNGIGVAAALAVADDPGIVHGPLELLFTVDEESALTGALGLDPALLRGRILVNLDSEEDWILFVGCAGGCTSELSVDLRRAPVPPQTTAVRVAVRGLEGGHSGITIHENRGNAVKILARVLWAWSARGPVLVETIEGGTKHNAIPREAAATVLLPGQDIAAVSALAAEVQRAVATEIGGIDPNLQIVVEAAGTVTGQPADEVSSRRLVQMLVALPHGVVTMSRDVAGVPETSTNLAIVATQGDAVRVTTSSRSSVAGALRAVLDQTAAICALAGGRTSEISAYPAWQPNMSSALLATCREVYRDLEAKDPIVTVIHAGLECGVIGEKLGGDVDMISFGPHLQGVHAPGERLNIPSVAKFWRYLGAVLRRLA